LRQLLFEGLERGEQRALARRTCHLGDELKAPPGSPHRCPTEDLHSGAVGDEPAATERLHPVHDAVDAGVFPLVFQGEI
jgi:hypothetical protein